MTPKRSTPTHSEAADVEQAPKKRSKRVPVAVEPLYEFSLESVSQAIRSATTAVLPDELVVKMFDQHAKTIYLTADRSSWVYHVPRWYRLMFKYSNPDSKYADWFHAAWEEHPTNYDTIKLFGKDAQIHRFHLACGNLDYRFSGNTFHARPFPDAFLTAVAQMQAAVVDPATNATRFNQGLINWYQNGDHYIGPHSDNEKIILPGSPILALSLGASRRFVFTPRAKPKGSTSVSPPSDANGHVKLNQPAGRKAELLLSDGDLVVMGGTTQRTHKHALPKMKACQGKRISITLRCFRPEGNL